MFELKGHKVIIKNLHVIENNRLVLFSDGDNDILYTGSNRYGNRILGSIVFEDDDSGFLRYIHVILTDDEYYEFLNKKKSLLKILEDVESFFLVDFNYNGKEINHSLVTINDMPLNFRPLSNSLCPDFITEPSLTYSASLKGNFADLHKAFPEDVNLVNTTFTEILLNATSFINELEVGRQVFVEALQVGSFRINFKIELNESNQSSLFSASTSKIKLFIQDYFRYVFNTLPDEEVNIFKKSEVTSENFKILEDKLADLYRDKNIVIASEGIEQKIIDLISFSVKSLKDIDYTKSFNRIEFLNISKAGEDIPVGLLDEKYIQSVEDKLFKPESFEKEDLIEIDDLPREYRIQVYSFNIQTGNGSANLILTEEKLDKISLHARGKDNYQNTLFTKSMDEGVIVDVSGIAKKVNGRVKELMIQF